MCANLRFGFLSKLYWMKLMWWWCFFLSFLSRPCQYVTNNNKIIIIIIIKGDRCRGREESLPGVTRSCWHDLRVSGCPAAQIFTGELTGKFQTANLKYFHFQTLNSISAEKNSTIIFPFPMDLVGHLFNKNWFFSRILKKKRWKKKKKAIFHHYIYYRESTVSGLSIILKRMIRKESVRIIPNIEYYILPFNYRR